MASFLSLSKAASIMEASLRAMASSMALPSAREAMSHWPWLERPRVV
ncbi:MAG: hypothetical protein LBE49_08840 [Deltaproteobacteria bacterium]|nr:hypothetical protein [Deltaproteobacteria bacterium]